MSEVEGMGGAVRWSVGGGMGGVRVDNGVYGQRVDVEG